jgi:3-oxoacyl-[acyl-carrier-protein] synthase II
MSVAREVVISGVGVVSPIGIGRDAFWKSLCEGQSGVRPLPPFDTPEFPVRFGAVVKDFDPKEYVTPRKSLKVMSRNIQLAYIAAQLASQDADLAAGTADPDRFGVVLGSDWINVEPWELIEAYRACMVEGRFDFSRWGPRALGEMYPLWMLKYLPNMPACHIAIAQDARGPNNSITLGEVSSLLALSEAARIIERGAADVMIAGGCGSRIHPLSWVFRSAQDLSRRRECPAAASRPFDRDRDGMVYGEGAAAFILESRQHAESRGAKIQARLLGQSSAFEPVRPGGRTEGTAIVATLRQALHAARLAPGDVGHVNAHGVSTIHHDRVEALAIREVLGGVPVTAPKSFFGNLSAGAGAVEMAASVLAFAAGEVPITLNYEHADPRCPVEVVHGRPCRIERQTALALNQSSTGQAVAVVLAGPN